MCVCIYLVYACTCGSQKKTLDALELELQEIVYSHIGNKSGPLHEQEMLLVTGPTLVSVII